MDRDYMYWKSRIISSSPSRFKNVLGDSFELFIVNTVCSKNEAELCAFVDWVEDFGVSSVSGILFQAFNWDDTPEGYSFWRVFFNKLSDYDEEIWIED